MGRPQVSFAKRQREQAKRDKKAMKAEKRAQRKADKSPESEFAEQLENGATVPVESPSEG